MCNLVEEKYRVASIMFVASRFTLADIQEKMETDRIPDAAYTVLGEMIEREFIEVSKQIRPIFNHKTLKLDEVEVKVYQVISGKRDELERYIAELDRHNLLPDAQGRPRGFNYRVLEQLIDEVVANPEKLEEEEVAIEQYLGLAQSDEISERQSDLRQRAISEAYLRTLYGKYFEVKQLWRDAIVQFLLVLQ